VEIFIHVELESHALDLVLLTSEMKKKNEAERRRRRRKKEKKKRPTTKSNSLREVTCKTKSTHGKTKSTPLLPSLPAKPKKSFFLLLRVV